MPDPSRTIARPFMPGYPLGFDDAERPRSAVIAGRVLTLSDDEIRAELAEVSRLLAGRHRDIEAMMLRRFEDVAVHLDMPEQLDLLRRMLVGAYFT